MKLKLDFPVWTDHVFVDVVVQQLYNEKSHSDMYEIKERIISFVFSFLGIRVGEIEESFVRKKRAGV